MVCKNAVFIEDGQINNLSTRAKVISALLTICIILFSDLSHSLERQKQIRRPPNGKGPTTVYIGLYLLDIIRLDQPRQLLRARWALSLNWKDTRMAFGSKDSKPAIFIGEEVKNQRSNMWWPDPQIINQISEITFINKRLLIRPDGDILYSAIFVVDTATAFEFRKFPFDSQKIRIEFESFSYTKDELDYKVWSERTGVNQKFQNDEWILYPISSTTGIRRLWGSEIANWSYASFWAPIERRTAYYVWRILLPFSFFILLSTCIFWMQRESLDRRVSIVAAFALTAVAFNFVVSGFFPNVSYLTILDAIILSGYLMCGITITSVIIFELCKHNGKEKIWNYGNITARFLFPLLYVLTWYFIYHVFITRKDQIIYLIEPSQ